MSIFESLFTKTNSINAVELHDKMQQASKDTIYVDVRTAREFQADKIKGFINIPLDALPNSLAKLPPDKEIVLICQSGGRSHSAAKFLTKNGYQKVINVTGGMGMWRVHYRN